MDLKGDCANRELRKYKLKCLSVPYEPLDMQKEGNLRKIMVKKYKIANLEANFTFERL